MSRFPGLLLCALLLLPALPCRAQEPPPAAPPVLLIGAEHAVALEPLAAWLGAACVWTARHAAVRVTLGARAVTLQAQSVVAQNAAGRPFRLPAPPVRRDGHLFVPTRAVVEALGGACAPREDGGMQVTLRDRALLLPAPPPGDLPADPAARLPLLIADPRLAVETLARSGGVAAHIRPYLAGFVKVATPVQPALTGIANSKALRLLTHVPVVGGLVSICQDAIGAITGTIGIARRLVEMDAQYLAPIRDGFLAAQAAAATPDAATIAAARPRWAAALAAVEKQRALNETADAHLGGMLAALTSVEAKMAEFRTAYPRSEHVLSLGPLQRAAEDLRVMVGAHHWQLTTMQAYFLALLAATAPAEEAGELPA